MKLHYYRIPYVFIEFVYCRRPMAWHHGASKSDCGEGALWCMLADGPYGSRLVLT